MLLRTRLPVPLALLPLLASACSDPERDPCQHDVCRIDVVACVERTAVAVACQLGLDDVTIPEVRMATTTELAAEIEASSDPVSSDHIGDVVDYYRGEALIGLMSEDYEYGDDRTAFLDWAVAYYSSDTEGVVIITDNLGNDREDNYLVLVHELVHAYQDSTRDLSALLDEHATTFDRFLGLRAAIEGEANHHDTIAAIELAGEDPEWVQWDLYYAEYKDWALEQAEESTQPSLDVVAYFPYAFGGELITDAWLTDGLDEIDRVFATPPDSVRQVMSGYTTWPEAYINGDAQLEPHAAPVMPERYEYLGGGHESVWLLNTMLQRTAGSPWAWEPTLESVSADYLSIFRDGDSGQLVVFWRVQTSTPDDMVEVLTGSTGLWAVDAGTHSISFVDDGLLLVATSGPLAADVLAEVEGWQTVDEVWEDADGEFSPRRLGPHGAPLGPCQHVRRQPG
jgi:hypothetical protein